MGLLIDASVLIEFERGSLELEPLVASHGDAGVLLSVITASELLHGVHRARQPGIRARREAWVEAVLGQFPVLEVDLPAARAHARLWAELAVSGKMIGAHDLWLAAQAIASGHTLVTANAREFQRVPGLQMEVWPGDSPQAG
jgi:tRNA(fMet)-specific endonuclease VapC